MCIRDRLIGDYLPSQMYVSNKEKKAKEVGIKSEVIRYPISNEPITLTAKVP